MKLTAERLLEHESLICSLVYRLTGSCDDCRDIVQETYLRALNEYQRGKEIINPRAWMCRVATNLAINHLRRKKKQRPLDDLPEEAVGAEAATDPTFPAEGFNPGLERALTRLAENERAAILLRYQSGFSLEEIAAALELTVPAVKSLMFRGRDKLRKTLGKVKR